ncbi:MAG TPA: TetR/AcrR family transcriptional regulator, partial [Gemmatimonadales bacterium]
MVPDETDDTRRKILYAARPLFAEYGFNGTSIRDITSAAGVNLGAVGYYFATKELLYLHLLQEIVGPLAPRIEWCMRGDDIAPLVKIERAVRAVFDHIRANPDMPAFMVREMATGRPPAQPILQTFGRIAPAMAAVIIEGQKRNEIRAGDPLLYILSIIAQPVHLFLGRVAISHITGIDFDDAHDRIVDHAVAVVRAG